MNALTKYAIEQRDEVLSGLVFLTINGADKQRIARVQARRQYLDAVIAQHKEQDNEPIHSSTTLVDNVNRGAHQIDNEGQDTREPGEGVGGVELVSNRRTGAGAHQ